MRKQVEESTAAESARRATRRAAAVGSADRAEAEAALARAVRPVSPDSAETTNLRDRFDPANTAILTCGNPASTADVQQTATRVGARAEVEPW